MSSFDRFFGNFVVIIDGLTRRKVRSFLTLLVIAIGIASVIGLVSIGDSIMGLMTAQFEKSGGQTILVTPGSGFASLAGQLSTAVLNQSDFDAIKKVNGVSFVSFFNFKMANANFNGKKSFIYLISTDAATSERTFVDGYGMSLGEGRFFRQGDNFKAIVGYLIANDKNNPFGREIKIGDSIEIEGKKFTVVGYLSQIGSRQDDLQVYIPNSAFEEIYGKSNGYYMFLVNAEKGANVSTVADSISDKLRKAHDLKKGEEDFSVQTYQQLIDSFNSVFSVIALAVTGIASISLLIGSIGIANTMFTSVLERTREIGSMKAVGATDIDIMFIFMSEAAFFGLVGGLAGVIIGYGISFLFSAIAKNILEYFFVTRIDWMLIAQMLLFSTAIGALSGFLPARRAAKMNVADAIRYE